MFAGGSVDLIYMVCNVQRQAAVQKADGRVIVRAHENTDDLGLNENNKITRAWGEGGGW